MLKTVQEIEDAINDLCLKAFPRSWDENHITYSLLESLRSIFSRREVLFDGWSKTVHWESFKNKGTIETRCGDIAFLVNIQFSSGEQLRGVAFIEAKRSFSSGNFESLVRRDQLEVILKSAPYAHLLQYNHQPQQHLLKFPDGSEWESHFWIAPMNTANELLKSLNQHNNQYLLRVSLPFSMYLTARIFWGHDLEYREDIYKSIAEQSAQDMLPSFLSVINVYYERQGQRPIEVKLSENWERV